MASKRKSSSDARRCSRDLLVKALYQWQIAGTAEKDLVAQFSADDEYSSVDKIHFKKLLKKSIVGAAQFDTTIERLASRSLAQLDAVGRAILLIALAELAFFDDVPTKVAINEAVDLAKRYGATDSYKFVNAVLDKAAREIRGESRV